MLGLKIDSLIAPSEIISIGVGNLQVSRICTGIDGRQRRARVLHAGNPIFFSFDSGALLAGALSGAAPSDSFSVPTGVEVTFEVPPGQVLYAISNTAPPGIRLSVHIFDDAAAVVADKLGELIEMLRQGR